MARTAFNAPAHIIAQRKPGSFGVGSNVSPDAAPSLAYGGIGIVDHRMPYNKFNNVAAGTITGGAIIGWAGGSSLVCTCDQAPATIAAGSIAAAANTTSGTAMTLVSSTAAGSTVLAAAFVSLPFLTSIPAAALACGGNPTYLSLGARDRTLFYDPLTSLTRAVQITGSSTAAGGAFTIAGYDFYGQAQTEVITHTGSTNVVAGLKTWKWIVSVTPGFSDAHNYSVEWTNIFGFHLGVDRFAYQDTYFNNAIVSSPAFVAADTTATATTTTGDVRGTVGPTNLTADGAKKLQLFVAPSAGRLTNSTLSTGLFGVVPA